MSLHQCHRRRLVLITLFSADRYLTQGNCKDLMPFVCAVPPLDTEPDNPCPQNYVLYQDGCIFLNSTTLTYSAATVRDYNWVQESV